MNMLGRNTGTTPVSQTSKNKLKERKSYAEKILEY
jgi:hypothetical protein